MQYVGLPIDPPATIRGRVRWPHTTYYQVLVRVPVMYFHDMDGNVSTAGVLVGKAKWFLTFRAAYVRIYHGHQLYKLLRTYWSAASHGLKTASTWHTPIKY